MNCVECLKCGGILYRDLFNGKVKYVHERSDREYDSAIEPLCCWWITEEEFYALYYPRAYMNNP